MTSTRKIGDRKRESEREVLASDTRCGFAWSEKIDLYVCSD